MSESSPRHLNDAGIEQKTDVSLDRPSLYTSHEVNSHQNTYYSYYGSSNRTDTALNNYTNNHVYDSRWDGQCVDQIEEECELQYQQKIQHEIDDLNPEAQQQHFHFGGKALPNTIISLAQKLLPTVVQRLNHQDDLMYTREWVDDYDHDNLEGRCAPLGSGSANLKTTGLDDNQLDAMMHKKQEYSIQQQRRISDLEMGDPSEYLPESAALLITALNNSTKKEPRKRGANISLTDIPSLLDEVFNEDNTNGNEEVKTFDNFEQEAEALLQSIQNEETTNDVASPRNFDDDDNLPSFDDDDSIGGDMVRLSRSIAFLQRDLEHVDMSHLDQLYDDENELDRFDGEGSAWSRMKLWFSRGMIMEQKLLNTINGMDGNNYGNGSDTATRNRYANNPVLIWSLAIMWAFVLLIMGHSKIAEWVEGEDPGRLADVIEWLFS
jgi:hypothetical protein